MTKIERGSLTVVMGPMFSNKTKDLVRRANQSKLAGEKLICFKPFRDVGRYSDKEELRSKSGLSYPAEIFDDQNPREIIDKVSEEVTVVIIDEVQWCLETIISVVEQLLTQGMNVIVAGLDYDYKGDRFGHTLDLFEMADEVEQLTAICNGCGEPATKSYAKVSMAEVVKVGAEDGFGAACETCYSSLRGDL